MSVKLKFQGESVQGGAEGTVEAIYVIDSAPTKEAALEQLMSSPDAPQAITHSTYGTLFREKVPQIDEIDAEQGYWTGIVRWTIVETSLAQPEPVISFNTIGGTGHILISKESLGNLVHPEFENEIPDINGAIGVSASGVDGTEIIVPTYEYEETHSISASAFTREFRQKIYRKTGTVCSHEFRDFVVGEGLFLGASASMRGRQQLVDVNFKFAGSGNREDIIVPGFATPITKRGWDYLWVYFREKTTGTKPIAPVAAAVFLERVYDYADWDFMPGNSLTVFNPLGI